MITALLLPAFVVPTPLDPRVVGASLFKNGYALVVREMKVSRGGEYTLPQIPEGSLGTVWLSATPGLKLEEAVSEMHDVFGPSLPTRSIDELLRANVGRQVHLLMQAGYPLKELAGKLVAADGEIVVIKTADGAVAAQKGSVTSLVVEGADMVMQNPTKSAVRGLRLTLTGDKPGSVYLVALQRGLTWAPNYQIDISDPKKLKLTAKATILNDLVDLKGADVRLVAGYPNVPYAGLPDPLTSANVDQFLMLIQGVGASPDQSGMGGGGFGGGGFGGGFAGRGPGGRGGELMGQAASAPQMGFGNVNVGDSMAGEQVDDLFFYSRPNTTLAKGERSYAMLFNMEGTYERTHIWKVDSGQRDYMMGWYFNYNDPDTRATYSPDVWDELRFRNESKQPISTGLAVAVNGDRMLGQQILAYTGPGDMAEFRVTKALEVATTYETKNVRDFPGHDGQPGYLFREGKITIRNGKKDAIHMEVEKEIVGSIEKSDVTPTEKEIAHDYNYQNPLEKLTFKVDVPARGTKTITFTYRVRHW